jgi:hypothetical protein
LTESGSFYRDHLVGGSPAHSRRYLDVTGFSTLGSRAQINCAITTISFSVDVSAKLENSRELERKIAVITDNLEDDERSELACRLPRRECQEKRPQSGGGIGAANLGRLWGKNRCTIQPRRQQRGCSILLMS